MPSRSDQIASKGMGIAKAVKATAKGIVGVFKTLMEQHGEVSALIRRVQKDAGKRADLWPQIRRELLSHERGELRVVYPALRERAETRELADRHDAEATSLEGQIAAVDQEPTDSTAWAEAFDRLVELVQAHVTFEENEVFPAAMAALGDNRARALAAPFVEAKLAEVNRVDRH